MLAVGLPSWALCQSQNMACMTNMLPIPQQAKTGTDNGEWPAWYARTANTSATPAKSTMESGYHQDWKYKG